jgi:hypothetical protein
MYTPPGASLTAFSINTVGNKLEFVLLEKKTHAQGFQLH